MARRSVDLRDSSSESRESAHLLRSVRRRVRATAYLRKWIVLGALIGVISGLGAALFFEALELATQVFLGALAGFVPASPLGEGANRSPTRPGRGCCRSSWASAA